MMDGVGEADFVADGLLRQERPSQQTGGEPELHSSMHVYR